MSLKHIVKKNLTELETKKLNSLTESKIVKGRIGIISESVNFNSKIHTTKFFNKLFMQTQETLEENIRTLETLTTMRNKLNISPVTKRTYDDYNRDLFEIIYKGIPDFISKV